MASPWHHPALAVAASHACPVGTGWHDRTAVPSVDGCHLTGSAAPKQQAQNIIHKQITDTWPLGSSWFQTLQTADIDTSSAINSNYCCSNSSILNVLISFLSNMAIQITTHFSEEKSTFSILRIEPWYRSRPVCTFISTPTTLPQFSVVDCVQFVILT